jgi:iron(III) transport system permease protein
MRVRPGQYVLLAALLAFLAAFLLWPIWLTIRGAFVAADGSFSAWSVLQVFRDPVLREGLVNSLLIAVSVTTLAVAIAMPLALVAARCDWTGKPIVTALLLLPLVLPPFVGALGVRQVLGPGGAVNTWLLDLGVLERPFDLFSGGGFGGGFGVVVAFEALALFPIVYLNLVAALANLDPALEDAATIAGASPWRRFRRVTLPLVRPGLFAGATIVLVWSFTELGTPLLFEYHRVTPVQIFSGIKEMEASRQPYALTAVMLATAIALYILGKSLLGRAGAAMQSRAATGSRTRSLRGREAAGANLLFLGVACFAALPSIAVVLTSLTVPGLWYGTVLPQDLTLGNYATALTHPLSAGAIRNSLFLAGIAVLIDVVVGFVAARLIVRSRIAGRWMLDALVMLPLAVPGLVMAFGYVAMTLSWPFAETTVPGWLQPVASLLPAGLVAWLCEAPLSGFADVLGADPNPMPLLVLAYAIRRLPYVVRSAAAGLEQTSVEVEEAATIAGAGRFLLNRRIVLPLVFANLVAGGLLAFAFSMLEVSDSLILAQRERDYPITKAIYTMAERLGDGPYVASALGVWGMALLATCLLGASIVLGRKMGALFRA